MKIETSNGEIVDKLTILEIKMERIQDSEKLKNIVAERNAIVRDAGTMLTAVNLTLRNWLKNINLQLWGIEDAIRECEKNGDFGDTFIRLARAVYRTNDRRAMVKGFINKQTNSTLFEEKSYKDYSNEETYEGSLRGEIQTRPEEGS